MKSTYLLFLIPLAIACSNRPEHFVLCGTVPGAMDSTEVDLRLEDRIIEPLRGYIVNDKFKLTGQLPAGAFYARLSMNNNDIAERNGIRKEDAVKYVEANIFIENGNLTFITPHIDSLPQSFWKYDIRRENNYTVKGSKSHEVYDQYRRATMDLQHRLRKEERALIDQKREPDAKAIAAIRKELRTATRKFIASQRNLPVNLHLAQLLEMEPFTYTQADLDSVTALFAGYTDTLPALKKFREDYRAASAYTQGKPFAGGEVYNPKGDTLHLNAAPGHYTLIDFWASWCGPCRASFPHLRKVYEAYQEKVDFISVSLDKNDSDWRKAMDEEKLPWQQYCATPSFFRAIGKAYKITSIPTFLLIGPDGNIIFSGHDSNDLDTQLEKLNRQILNLNFTDR